MDNFNFYKEFYFKELDNRNEINNSLSLPIGLITALVAGIFYLITNFDYKYFWLTTVVFLITILVGFVFLVLSVYHLIKAYSDFPKGYEYSILADTNDLNNYYQELKNFYSTNNNVADTSFQEFENYVLVEMIRNTGDNQKNNKRKNKFRYNCEKYLISSFIFICLSLPTFCIDFSLKKNDIDKVEVKITNQPTIKAELNSKNNRNFMLDLIKDSVMANSVKTQTVSPKPTPPRSQVIKEGQNPKPKSH